jgi:molybdopterin synthase catalytic subunit
MELNMDINKALKDLKQDPQFAERVGMVLVHNGVVRSWSREDGKKIKSIEVKSDLEKIESIRREYEQHPGIFKILIQAYSGQFKPGDDLLYIIVAGDIRENVKKVLSEVLEKVKSEAVSKNEIF